MTNQAATEQPTNINTSEQDERLKREQLRRLLTDKLIAAVQEETFRASTLAVAVRFLAECGSIADLPPNTFDTLRIPTTATVDQLPYPAPAKTTEQSDGLPYPTPAEGEEWSTLNSHTFQPVEDDE